MAWCWHPRTARMSDLAFSVPDGLVEMIAQRAADIMAEKLAPATRWLTIPEAAEHARCKPQRIYDLRSGGVLRKTGDGARALVDRQELDRLLEGGGV